MIFLSKSITIDCCPHCGISHPNYTRFTDKITNDLNNNNKQFWKFYVCRTCGGVIMGYHNDKSEKALGIFPDIQKVDISIPNKPREFLHQAIKSIHAPAGAIMLAASSIDVMLKIHGYKDGSLYHRINKAAENHLITDGMAKWAHQIRLDANEQRHADIEAELPSQENANRIIEFAKALAHFLFVLPERVEKGLQDTAEESSM